MFNYKKHKLIRKYNAFREKPKDTAFCIAPFTSLRFHRNGGVQICCHHIDFLFLQEKSLKEIWFGAELNKLRNQMKTYDIPKSCSFCSTPFYANNFSNVNAVSFDKLEQNENGYPVLMDFSLENTCNLECIMCDSSLSSSIAKSKLCDNSGSKFEYGEEFVSQLGDFLPHLKSSIFTGGEPFLIKSYYSIWEKMIEVNPDVIINITTNGTVYNSRIENILKQGKFNITVSFDSFEPDVYNEIRIGAEFDKTWTNVLNFSDYCKQMGTVFSITVCPMQINRMDIPQVVRKCNEKNWDFSYNTVLKPWSQALWSLSSGEMQKLIDYYKSEKIKKTNSLRAKGNIAKFNSLVLLLEDWLIKIKGFESQPVSENEIQELKASLEASFEEKLLGKYNDEDLALLKTKITEVFNQMPSVLISEEFLKYFSKFDSNTLRMELEENDIDTIIDHMCIVSFNL